MAATSTCRKKNINNVGTFKMMQKQATIDKLRDEVTIKKSDIISLNLKVKTVLHGAALEKEVMMEKQLLFDKKIELEKTHTERMKEKTEKITSLKKQFSDDINI